MGLKNNDLKDTVANLISVDEYESKTGAPYEIIVVAFHVIDELPADDLSDFISKSYIPVVDSEKSPNPNDEGYFLVFVEMKRDEKFFENLHNLISEVERLCGKQKWKVSPYLDDNVYKYNDEQWKQFVITDPLQYITKREFIETQLNPVEDSENVDEYFKESTALKIVKEGSLIKFYGQSMQASINVVKWYNEKDLLDNEDFKNTPFNLHESRIEIRKIKNILGPNWDIYSHDNKAVISRKGSERILYAELA